MNGKVKYEQSNKKIHLNVFCYTLHKQKVCVLAHILLKFSRQKNGIVSGIKSKYCCSTHTIIFSNVRKIAYFIDSTTPKKSSYFHINGQNFMNQWMWSFLSVKMFGFLFHANKAFLFIYFLRTCMQIRGEKYFYEIPQLHPTKVGRFRFAVIIQKWPLRIFPLKYFITYFLIKRLFNYM